MSNSIGSGQRPNYGMMAAGIAGAALANPTSLLGAMQSSGSQASSSSAGTYTSFIARPQRYSNAFTSSSDIQAFANNPSTRSTLLGHSVNRHTNRNLTAYFSGEDNRRDDPELRFRNQMGMWSNGSVARSSFERTLNRYAPLIRDWRNSSDTQDLVIDAANPQSIGGSYRRLSRATPTNDATYDGGDTPNTRTVLKRDPKSPTGFRLASHYPIAAASPLTPGNLNYSQIVANNYPHRRRLDDADDMAEAATDDVGLSSGDQSQAASSELEDDASSASRASDAADTATSNATPPSVIG